MCNLYSCDSYFHLFEILNNLLDGSTNFIDRKNIVFCEEKISLMVERSICSSFKGSFNTDVYSFGNYLRAKKRIDKSLDREGSAMVVKKILGELNLNCLQKSKNTLAPSLFELITQLKSAKISPDTLSSSIDGLTGILKNKLSDIVKVYSAYENYIAVNGYVDQSSALSLLPEVLENSETIKNANVYIFGFTGFTSQIQTIILTLIKRAKSVNFILPYGENKFAFVNESASVIKSLCSKNGIELKETFIKSPYEKEGEIIKKGLFNPFFINAEKTATDKVCVSSFLNPNSEALKVAEIIKQKVIYNGYRYKDFTVILSDTELYKRAIKSAFTKLDIPYFLDEKKNVCSHPLITLIETYTNVFIKGLNLRTYLAFVKSPYISSDKDFLDKYENYLVKYNIDYNRLKTAFIYDLENEETKSFEQFRAYTISLLDKFNVLELLDKIVVEEKINGFSSKLNALNENEESAINNQIYQSVVGILQQIETILPSLLSPTEFLRIYKSGVSCLQLSIIPQYNDAVFIGGFKEASFSKAKILFALGLNGSVPKAKEDIALLSDSDIDMLENFKLLVEPKIKVINHRAKEEVMLGLSAFTEKAYYSYSLSDYSGVSSTKSEVLTFIEKAFTCNPYPPTNSYLTVKQGLENFAINCSKFAFGLIDDFTESATFYKAVNGKTASDILDYAETEVKIRLNSNKNVLLNNVSSPTAIEDYYKCPYRSFVSHALKVKDKEKGEVDSLKSGNLMHDIFKDFVKRIDKIKSEQDFEKIFNDCAEFNLGKQQYVGFFVDEEALARKDALILECKKFCRKTYEWFTNSLFSALDSDTEVKFGDTADSKYPAISLLNGKVKLSGKIDRVDYYKNYCRVIDYKTGKVEDDEKGLFTGRKMQLYLYALAVRNKMLCGAYYLPVSNAYEKPDTEKPLVVGNSLDDEECLKAQDVNFSVNKKSSYIQARIDKEKMKDALPQQSMEALKRYALKMSETAVSQLNDGVIIASPYKDTCEYCEFKSLCKKDDFNYREVGQVKVETIVEAVSEDDKCRS